jgi:hypothetical protein
MIYDLRGGLAKQKIASDIVWWGEAPDEPAREDARPTGILSCAETDSKHPLPA